MQNRGIIRAGGKRLLDGSGRPFQIRGVNLGNWLVPENYMALSDVGTFETGRYTIERGLRAMRANPNLTDEQIAEIERICVENYITERARKTYICEVMEERFRER